MGDLWRAVLYLHLPAVARRFGRASLGALAILLASLVVVWLGLELVA